MSALDVAMGLDAAQRQARDHPAEGPGLAIVGPPGSGKTDVLVLRAAAIAAQSTRITVLSSANPTALARLCASAPAGVRCTSLGEIAFELLREQRRASGLPDDLRLIDDAQASLRFESAGAELFALEWTEFAAAELDPEIPGMRVPERFAAAAYRLIRKLRASLVTPAEFKAQGLRGAAGFYSHPPNFASAELLVETPAKYRDSLRVTPHELERQREREVDLLKILARLYATYVANAIAYGEFTAADAVYEATLTLRADRTATARARAALGAALIDDAADLTDGDVAFLEAIFGEALHGVTFAGDAAQRTRGFGGGARLTAFRKVVTTITLAGSYRNAPGVAHAARIALGPASDLPASATPTFTDVGLYRAQTQREEARFIASEVVRALARGVAPERIAVVVRNVACAHPYIDALLARDVATDVRGNVSLYAFPAVLDALGALWSAVDPYRHDWMMRNLEAPWLRLCDASIATLCSEAADAQPLLFELPPATGDDAPRWDQRRDLRLGRNVTRGDLDATLNAEARARIVAFREARAAWDDARRALDLPALARRILAQTSFASLHDDARGRFDRDLVARLLDEIDVFAMREPLADLDAFLQHAERLAESEGDLLTIVARNARAVWVCDPDALAGASFDVVFAADVRAGAWPRYYTPDAFLFTPKLGMIPKDNVGDVRAARTAKFTYASGRFKFRSSYNDEDRRAFYLAATRATNALYVTASGRATLGKNTPELLTELERARDLTQS